MVKKINHRNKKPLDPICLIGPNKFSNFVITNPHFVGFYLYFYLSPSPSAEKGSFAQLRASSKRPAGGGLLPDPRSVTSFVQQVKNQREADLTINSHASLSTPFQLL